MTARLTRWLTSLDNFEARMAQLPSVRRYGRLTRATGLVLEATGLQLPLGRPALLNVRKTAKPVKSKAKLSVLTDSACS
jgi:flagellum-specific ATP synthase